MTKITIDALNPDSFARAADRVRKLQKTYVNKNREFVKRLTEAGISVILAFDQHIYRAGSGNVQL